jgi:hypothetical protein
MEFHLLLTNPRKKWWLLLYLAGWAGLCLAVARFFESWDDALTRLSPALDAGLKVVALLLFGAALYGFEWLQNLIREPVRVTVSPDGLAACYQQSGRVEAWPFAQLRAYTYQNHSRYGTFLKLALRGGKKVKWQTGDFGFNYRNTDAFAAMAQAFEAAWARYQHTNNKASAAKGALSQH